MFTYYADIIVEDAANRLDITELRTLTNQMNCNQFDAEDNGETWFDEEIPVGYTTEIDEVEFFNRYF